MSDAPTGEQNVYAQRLLNVAKALRESTVPHAFDMSWYTHGLQGAYPCGTPMCALGHYGAREDLQSAFRINQYHGTLQVVDPALDRDRFLAAEQHFDLNQREAEELFGCNGCGDASTVEAAATYIEGFVARKYQVSIDG